ncbi:MAG: septum formation initiator family protein [Longimicrobiales bacterium]|nr:septum formation initiator family protein [Longimicrobiales bacterium]
MGRLTRILLPGLLLLGLYYAFFGGRVSVFELRRAHRDLAAAEAELARVRALNDSLRAWADSLADDPAVLERFAREEFGMIRGGEVLYRFDEAGDSTPPGDTLAPR